MEEIEDFTPSGLTITELTTRFLIMRDQVAELTARAERTEKQLDVYQNEIVPGFRDRAEQAEAEATRLDNALHQQTNRALQAEARENVLQESLELVLKECLDSEERNKYYSWLSLKEYVKEVLFKPTELCHTCRYNKKKCETILDCVNGSGWKEIVKVEAKK